MADSGEAPRGPQSDDFAYLLVQLGFHVAAAFSKRLAPLGLEPRHFGMLTRLAANQGKSQQAIGELMGLNPTRMAILVNELAKAGRGRGERAGRGAGRGGRPSRGGRRPGPSPGGCRAAPSTR